MTIREFFDLYNQDAELLPTEFARLNDEEFNYWIRNNLYAAPHFHISLDDKVREYTINGKSFDNQTQVSEVMEWMVGKMKEEYINYCRRNRCLDNDRENRLREAINNLNINDWRNNTPLWSLGK